MKMNGSKILSKSIGIWDNFGFTNNNILLFKSRSLRTNSGKIVEGYCWLEVPQFSCKWEPEPSLKPFHQKCEAFSSRFLSAVWAICHFWCFYLLNQMVYVMLWVPMYRLWPTFLMDNFQNNMVRLMAPKTQFVYSWLVILFNRWFFFNDYTILKKILFALTHTKKINHRATMSPPFAH